MVLLWQALEFHDVRDGFQLNGLVWAGLSLVLANGARIPCVSPRGVFACDDSG